MSQKKHSPFFGTERSIILSQGLKAIEADASYETHSTYSSDAQTYPDHRLPFHDKHMIYVSSRPNIEVHQYLSNLRLITKKRA